MNNSPERTRILRGWLYGTLVILGLAVFLQVLHVYSQVPSDFMQDYWAARSIRDGRSIYDLRAFGQEEQLDSVTNAHPPFVAVLFLPLTLLSSGDAFKVFGGLSLLLYLGGLWCVLRTLQIRVEAIAVVGLALCWYPFIAHIALGQISLLLVASILGAWCCLRHGREWEAGVLLGFACAIKLFPLIFALYLLLRRRWKALALMVLMASFFFVIPLAVVSPDDYGRYFLEVTPNNFSNCVFFPVNLSMISVINRFLSEGPWVVPLADAPQLIQPLTWTFTLAVVLILCKKLLDLPSNTHGDDLAFSYVCLAMLLLAPISWLHIFPLLILPFGLIVEEFQRSHVQKLKLCLLLIFLAVSLPYFQIGSSLAEVYAPYRVPWYVALVLILPILGIGSLWWLLEHLEVMAD